MKTLTAFLLLTLTAWAEPLTAQKSAPEQGPPPKNLTQRADGHFTANNDPTNPENFEVYVVLAGDTLSGIAGQVLKNPRLWPQIWEQNEHIVNPHWIYPNDKILIRPVTQITEVTPPAPAPEPPPPTPAVSVQEPPVRQVGQTAPPRQAQPAPAPGLIIAKARPVAEIKMGDMLCSGFVQKTQLPKDLKVIAKFNSDNSALATEGDYVYLGQGTEDGLQVGAKYEVIRPTRKLEAPNGATRAERDLGMHYLEIAQVQVSIAQPDFAIARVVTACEAIEIGDIMLPSPTINIPVVARPRPFNPFNAGREVAGSVVITKGALSNFGSVFKGSGAIPGIKGGHLGSLEKGVASEGMIVYLNIGAEGNVKPGDVFVVSREIQLDTIQYEVPPEVEKLEAQRIAIGEVVILKVGERASTALVTYAADGVSAGDSVERR